MTAVEDYRKVTADDGSAEGRNWDAVIPAADAAIAELDDALHSAFDDFRVDFPESTIADYDEWLALHVTCGKEMRAP